MLRHRLINCSLTANCGLWTADSKLQPVIVLVKVNHHDDEKYEVNEEPHHGAAFFAFIFDMVGHDGIFLMKDFVERRQK